MKPVLHKSNRDEGGKPVRLFLEEECGQVRLLAVDNNGNRIAYLMTFFDDGVISAESAKEILDRFGYDTSFADWNESGAMVVK